jgi:prolipoprotein diacylglyceryl transferase
MTLASIPSPHTGTVDVGPLVLHMYGLMLLLAIAACIGLTGYRWVRLGGDWDLIMRVAVWGVAAGVVGARGYHDITSWNEVPSPKWKGIFEVWQGGLGVWGGILVGALVGCWVAKRSLAKERATLPAEIERVERELREGKDLPASEVTALNESQRRLRARYEAAQRLNALTLLDAAAPGLLLAQGIGRWGNWWNQELFGKPTNLPWGLKIDDAHRPLKYADRATFHPTFLYEFVFDLVGVGILLLLDRRFRFRPPALFALYISVYTFGRTFEEFIRVDPSHHVAGLRLNALVSIVVFALSTAFFVWWQFVRKGAEPAPPPPPSDKPAGPRRPRRSFKLRRPGHSHEPEPPKMAIPKGRVRPSR